MNKVVKLLVFIALSLSLSACGNKVNLDKETLEYRNVTFTKDESEKLLIEIIHFIENTGSSDEFIMFNSNVSIDSNDITSGAGVSNYKYYISSNAAYFQIGNTMYRFQFNSSNKVASYIKYTVEA